VPQHYWEDGHCFCEWLNELKSLKGPCILQGFSGIFAVLYTKLIEDIPKKGDFGDIALPRLLKVNEWVVVVPAALLIVLILAWMEIAGF
jgi:hypothetical protein